MTSFYWWTKDWWRPTTFTGTVVGIEDFVMGFTTGGIMSVIYDLIFNKGYKKTILKHTVYKAYFVGLFMASLTAWLFIMTGLTSFWASTISMFLVIVYIIFVRRDLFLDSLVSGVAMMFISVIFYFVIILLSSTWINNTYLHGLSGFRIYSIPIEEFVFWFLAGMWVGPFYEFAFGKKLGSVKV